VAASRRSSRGSNDLASKLKRSISADAMRFFVP
jgi:hypothetical protein